MTGGGEDRAAATARRAAALAEAAALLARHRDDEEVAAAAATADRARARLGHGTDHTVVALAGQTGAGKSSLVNALVGSEVSRVAVTRPTTSRPLAVVHGGGADGLLDWLDLRDRHTVPAPAGLGGLVLVDLPDMDSVAAENRAESTRLVGLADLVVVVTDPQKYADQVLHEQVLAPLSEHEGVVRVVLNKADQLTGHDLDTCLAELARLLHVDGFDRVDPLAVSATSGAGVDELRDDLGAAVRARRVAVDRLRADLRLAAAPLLPAGASTVADDALVATATDGLADAVATGHVAAVVAAQHRHDGRIATGWPVTRWVRRLRRAPLRDVPTLGQREVASDAVRATLRTVGEQAGRGLESPWDRIVRDVARGREAEVAAGLDHITTRGVEALRDRPQWWRAVAAAQGGLLLAALVGAAWLGAIVLGESLLLLELDAATPRWRGLPLPTLLLVGGVAGGWLTALLARAAVAVGARRRRRRAARSLRRKVADVARAELVAPVRAALADRARVAELLGDVVD